jgi:hypothetical protein
LSPVTTVQFLDGLHSWVHKLENLVILAVHVSKKDSVIMAAKIIHCIFVSKVNRCICNYFILSSEQRCSGLAGIFLIVVCVATKIKQGIVFFSVDKELMLRICSTAAEESGSHDVG